MSTAPLAALRPADPPSDAKPTVDLVKLDRERRALVRDCERLEARLGRLRTAKRFGPNLLPYRTRLKTELADKRSQIRGIDTKIKNERRRRATLLADGTTTPRDPVEMIAALYRIFMDAVDPKEWDNVEQAVMRRARDYVQNGVVA